MVRIVRVRFAALKYRVRQAVFDQVIVLHAAALVVHGQFARKVHVLQRRARKPCIAPVPVYLLVHVQIARAQRAAAGYFGAHALSHHAYLFAAALPCAMGGAHTLKVRKVIRGHYAQVFVEVVDKLAPLVQKRVQHRLCKALHARIEHDFGTAAAYVYRVELYAARLTHVL